MMNSPRIAVVGSGAATFGTLYGIFKKTPNADITVFDLAQPSHSAPVLKDQNPETVRAYYDSIYVKLKSEMGLRFPPMKTHFGESFERITVDQSPRFFKSALFGGMTNFWGATLLPFTDSDFKKWPITTQDMAPYYKDIAHAVGISGRSDGLNKYFSPEYITRPEFYSLKGFERIDQVVNAANTQGPYNIVSGQNRVGLETREGHKQSCTGCGECMAGCYRNSIFTAKDPMQKWLSEKKFKLVQGRVLKVDKDRRLQLEDLNSRAVYDIDGFDRVFLGAGALGTAEIVMRSLDIPSGPVLYDNAIFQFPILNLGSASSREEQERYVALSNIIFALFPSANSGLENAQVQLYPNFDYLWRNVIPEWLWPLARGPVAAFRDRLMWARTYLHSKHCYAYNLNLDSNGQLQLSEKQSPDRSAIKPVIQSLKEAFQGSGFKILPVRPVVSKTSSHLAGPFGYDSPLISINRTGEILPGVHICDSAVFPDSPATSLTFTIMSNAYRTATESLG